MEDNVLGDEVGFVLIFHFNQAISSIVKYEKGKVIIGVIFLPSYADIHILLILRVVRQTNLSGIVKDRILNYIHLI